MTPTELAERGLRVKPLEWQPWDFGDGKADSILGTYHVWLGYWRGPDMEAHRSDDPKAAAEADYALCIAAQLEGMG